MAHLSFFIAYPSVELFALQADEVISRLEDATLGGDGSSRVDVVPSDHPHCDTSTLAFPDGVWDLRESGNTVNEEMRGLHITGDIKIKVQVL